MTADPTLDRSAFREWLAGFEPDEIAGVRCEGCDCPIARYLAQRYATERVSVLTTAYSVDSFGASLPAWARSFVRAVDVRGVFVARRHVTASEALAVLDRVGA